MQLFLGEKQHSFLKQSTQRGSLFRYKGVTESPTKCGVVLLEEKLMLGSPYTLEVQQKRRGELVFQTHHFSGVNSLLNFRGVDGNHRCFHVNDRIASLLVISLVCGGEGICLLVLSSSFLSSSLLFITSFHKTIFLFSNKLLTFNNSGFTPSPIPPTKKIYHIS